MWGEGGLQRERERERSTWTVVCTVESSQKFGENCVILPHEHKGKEKRSMRESHGIWDANEKKQHCST